MPLDPVGMSAAMLARAVSGGLVDTPPNFALSRIYNVMARGVVATLIDPTAVVVTVSYTGNEAQPILTGVATSIGWDNLNPDRYHPLVLAQTTFTGLYSVPFFSGIGGIVEYAALNVTMTDVAAATGTGGTGVLTPGGVVLNANKTFDNMEAEAVLEDIMVVNLAHLGGNPGGTIQDPTTGVTLGLGDLFIQAETLLKAVADQLTVELAFASKSGIPTIGATTATPLAGVPTITTVLL